MTTPPSQRMELRRILLRDLDDLARRLYHEGYEAGKAAAAFTREDVEALRMIAEHAIGFRTAWMTLERIYRGHLAPDDPTVLGLISEFQSREIEAGREPEPYTVSETVDECGNVTIHEMGQ